MDEPATSLWDQMYKVDQVNTGTIHALKMVWPRPIGNMATEYKDTIDMSLEILEHGSFAYYWETWTLGYKGIQRCDRC